MLNYCIQRLVASLALTLVITCLVFLLMHLSPGDFLTELRASKDFSKERIVQMEHAFGLDKPWYVQYGYWLRELFRLNLGDSWTYKTSVVYLIGTRMPATVLLAMSAWVVSWMIAIPLGVLSAYYRNTWIDAVCNGIAYVSLSFPAMFLALMAVIFAAVTGWFPTGGYTSLEYDFLPQAYKVLDVAHHLVLPTSVLALSSIAYTLRLVRMNCLEYMHAEFVMTARAKGLGEWTILFKHVLKNALNPLVTSFGFLISSLLSGSLLVETIMNYPGLGQLLYEAFLKKDQYVVMASVTLSCGLLMMGNLIADILVAYVDPRIRLMDKEAR